MKTITYDAEDILPLTLNVLNKCVNSYACNAYKLVVDREYPDLKGMVVTDRLDDVAIELLDCVQTIWFEIITDSIAALNKTMESLANINGLDVQTVVDDLRIDELATDFYCGIIMDRFPRDDEEPDEDEDDDEEEDLVANLQWYTFSMIAVISCLYDLTIRRFHDVDKVWMEYWSPLEFTDYMHEDEEHRVTLDHLQGLGKQLEMDYYELIGMNF